MQLQKKGTENRALFLEEEEEEEEDVGDKETLCQVLLYRSLLHLCIISPHLKKEPSLVPPCTVLVLLEKQQSTQSTEELDGVTYPTNV